MGAGNCFPKSYADKNEMANWYIKTPKWKLAEMLLQYAFRVTDCEYTNKAFRELQHESENPFYKNRGK